MLVIRKYYAASVFSERCNLGSFLLNIDHVLSRTQVLLSLSDSIVDFPRSVIAEFPTVFSCFEAVTGSSASATGMPEVIVPRGSFFSTSSHRSWRFLLAIVNRRWGEARHIRVASIIKDGSKTTSSVPPRYRGIDTMSHYYATLRKCCPMSASTRRLRNTCMHELIFLIARSVKVFYENIEGGEWALIFLRCYFLLALFLR